MLRRSFLQLMAGTAAAIVAPVTAAKVKIAHRWGALDSSALELPKGIGWARHIDGLRELRQYDLAQDCFLWRWDTMVAGEQWNYCTRQFYPAVENAEEFSAKHRARAIAAFRNMTAMRGRIAYFHDAA